VTRNPATSTRHLTSRQAPLPRPEPGNSAVPAILSGSFDIFWLATRAVAGREENA